MRANEFAESRGTEISVTARKQSTITFREVEGTGSAEPKEERSATASETLSPQSMLGGTIIIDLIPACNLKDYDHLRAVIPFSVLCHLALDRGYARAFTLGIATALCLRFLFEGYWPEVLRPIFIRLTDNTEPGTKPGKK